jgi:hypothetical protein
LTKQEILCEEFMRGVKHIKVSNRKATFKLELHRNITILSGDSGTGKTTLYNMIADYSRLGDVSGVNLSSDSPCLVLTDGKYWLQQLQDTKDSIVFIDEGMKAIFTKEFARAVKNSSNYYVLITREALHELPYSVDEIYEIKTSGKMHTMKRRYPASKNLHRYTGTKSKKFDTLLTEDSNSGYQFFSHHFRDSEIQCLSANSNSNIYKWLKEHPKENVLVIADGAAFGAEMDRVIKECAKSKGAHQLCLPESFEWLILKSGLIKANHLTDMLENTSDYIECAEYFSWEKFFTAYLTEVTKDTPFSYRKSEINQKYLIEKNRNQIANEIL